MAQVLIRNLNDETVARLKRKADRSGISLEAFLRQLLSREAPSRTEAVAEIEALRTKVAPPDPSEPTSADLIREMRQARTVALAGEE
ncbi:MAG: ribbon-helix-helix protein, CopG family [Terricaulis sp.]